MRKKVIFFSVVIILLVIYVYGILLIRPTFDDFTTLSAPKKDADWLQYFVCYGSTWRPVDALLGYLNGIDTRIFPASNHLIVIAAHLTCVYLVFRLSQILGVSRQGASLAALFYFISPCMLGTVLSVDATNQTLCQLFGLISVMVLINGNSRGRYVLWAVLIFLSALSKDNGITWACTGPVLAFAKDDSRRKPFVRKFMLGISVAVLYAVIRLSLPVTEISNTDYGPLIYSFSYKLKAIATWIGYTWSATDYISIFYTPERNFFIVAITFLLSAPIMFIAFFGNRRVWRRKKTWIIVVAIFISASANLVIEMSVMNTYCSLATSALLFGYLIDEYIKVTGNHRLVGILMSLYVVSAVIVDLHHWYNAWQTSLPSKFLAEDIIRKSHHKARKAYVITVKDKNPKYSSFCVPVEDVTGWGRDVLLETGYTWPEMLRDTTIDNTSDAVRKAEEIAADKLREFDAVWIVLDRKKVIVRENDNNITK